MLTKYFTTMGTALAANSIVTPPGFTPTADVLLGLLYNKSTTTITPGSHFSPTDVASEPSLALQNTPDKNARFLGLMVDPDVQYIGQTTTFLHWLAQDLIVIGGGGGDGDNQADREDAEGSVKFPLALTNTSANLATYIGPAPPAGEGDHRYVFYVFAQPGDFAVGAGEPDYNAELTNRLFFDLEGFISEHVLGEPGAADYLLVSNDTVS